LQGEVSNLSHWLLAVGFWQNRPLFFTLMLIKAILASRQ
jgi:hypothetical protein